MSVWGIRLRPWNPDGLLGPLCLHPPLSWLKFARSDPDNSAFVVARKTLGLTYSRWFAFPVKEGCVYFEEVVFILNCKQLGRWYPKRGWLP